MGDRATVTLTILNEHIAKVKQLSGEFGYEFPYNNTRHCIQFYEVNYGNLDFLNDLESLGIAYESEWESGGEYTSGTRYCRFTSEGLIDTKDIYDNERNPQLGKLMALINDPMALTQFIILHNDNLSVLPWDNQAEYGKLYAALSLITPKT